MKHASCCLVIKLDESLQPKTPEYLSLRPNKKGAKTVMWILC